MEKYEDLEINILSCLLQRPELMEKVVLEDKHFKKHNRFWKFMKAFYKKFGTFDLVLMYQVVKNKYEYLKYAEWLITVEPSPSKFTLYQKQLLDSYRDDSKSKWVITHIYDLANELYVKAVSLDDFKIQLEKIYEDADKLFKEVKNNGED